MSQKTESHQSFSVILLCVMLVSATLMAHKNKTNFSPYTARQKAKGGSSAPRTLKGRHHQPEKVYDFHEASDRLYDVFRNHGFGDYPHEKRAEFVKFYQLLMEAQTLNNFTRLLKLRDVAIKHFIDCLMVPQLTDLRFPLLDLGTGPGFPGIPLKIEFPDQKIILAEGVQKRVEFLKTVRDEMKLKNLDIIGRNINPSFIYPVNGVITRAVEDIRNTLGNVIHCLQTGGRVYFMKGPGVNPEIETAAKEMSEYYKLVENIDYSLPETTHDRRLVIYEKIKAPPPPDTDALEKEYGGSLRDD